MKSLIKDIRIFILLLMTVLTFSVSVQAAYIDKVVAVVNDDIITASDVEGSFAPVRKQYESIYTGEALRLHLVQGRRQVLERLIDNVLVVQDAKKRGLTITPEELETQVNSVILKFESEKVFVDNLQKQGLTLDSFKAKMKKQLLLQKYRRVMIGNRVRVLPSDLLQYFNENKHKYIEAEEVRASQVFIDKEDDSDFARRKIHEILESLKNGEDFDEVVKTFAQENEVIKSGDLGFFKKGQMLKEIEDEVFTMQVGEVSDIIESASGYHIVKVTAYKERREPGFDDLQEEVRLIVFNNKAEAEYRKVIDKLKEDAYIEVKVEMV